MIASASLASHCQAPPGLLTSSHSWPKSMSKKPLLHWVGVGDQVTSRPEVMASAPLPLPWSLIQPSPCWVISAASGSGPTWSSATAAPWVLPKVWPPAMSATVSSSFIAIRPKVSRM